MKSSASVIVLLHLSALLSAQQAFEPQAPLTFEQSNRRAAEPRLLSLRYAEFDTSRAEPAIPADLVNVPAGVDYFLVQVRGPVDEANKQALTRRGLELMDYVPNHAWIVRGTAAQVATCVADGTALWSSPLHAAYRVDPELLAATTERRVAVLGFAGGDIATLVAQTRAAGATIVEEAEQIGRWLVVAIATPDVVRALARSRDVQWVEPESVVTERNDTMTWSVQTGVTNSRTIWTKGLHGEGQVIGHQDSGIATSSCYFSDPVNPIGPLHRKIVYRSGTGTGSHGTHTAGTSAGDAFPINGSTASRGLAYAAKIAHSSDYSASVWATRATTHRSNGARVYTNSWGNDSTTAYNSHCNAIDAFQWTNEDDLVFFAETNLSTLKNPENAKNLVAVGNAQNGANYNNKGGGGTGPTADGRRKPDLFTPGSSIISAGTSACATASSTGTSMACPSATAAGALVRQYFMDGFYPSGTATPGDAHTPTGALVKAVLINTCTDMTGVAGYPSNSEGWGRVVLDESLHFAGDAGRLWVADVRRATGLTTGGQRDFLIDVTSTTRPLEITLAFTDFAGTTNAANPVVNDLSLLVIAPGGATQYLGNVFTSGWSSTGGSADLINNVERVAVQVPTVGTWTVRVVGTSVPQGPCGYALAATGMLNAGFALAKVSNYGAGKPGIFGVPTIQAPLPIQPSAWGLNGTATVPNSFGGVILGYTQTAIPFDGGTILASFDALYAVATGPTIGSWTLPVPLPVTYSLSGATLFWQFVMPNDLAASGEHYAASAGLRTTIGN